LKSQLALWVAAGGRISVWCKAHNIARQTGYKWYATDEFRRMVEEYRRRAVDRAIGKMARSLEKAVEKMVELIERGQTDAVKLAAAKTLVDKLIEIQEHADLKADMARLSERLDDARERCGAR
jgi:ABC-type uncharacterized transport system ATPase component